ncbi:MAG TPA: cell division ATP-binding protein FtsE [Candidatus Bathyarchaeia archaeon]|nr:cell division ATP-binding protein FtsE [Candidatus Bathyarchaeia archaeon]
MIIFNKVSKKFNDGTLVLDDVSFTINKGEFVFLVGHCGAGKTTVSRILLKEILPTRGRVFVDGEEITKLKKKNVPQLRRKIGTAFQDFKLLPDRTVKENISLALEIIRQKKEDISQKVDQLLSLVGLQGKEDFFPQQLSGGEVQRVVIARALAHNPKILFADEPTGNLDIDTAWQIIDLLKRINEKGMTVVVATHNVSIVDDLGQRVIRLEKGKVTSDKKEAKYQEERKSQGQKAKVEKKETKKEAKNPKKREKNE